MSKTTATLIYVYSLYSACFAVALTIGNVIVYLAPSLQPLTLSDVLALAGILTSICTALILDHLTNDEDLPK